MSEAIADPLVERRLKWLVSLAWSGGDKGLQSGWWPYVSGELDRLEAEEPGTKDRALAELKKLRESVAT